MSEQEQQPSGSVYDYYGCSLPKMKADSVVLGMTLQMKVMADDGGISFHEFAVGVSKMEQLGMLESASDTLRAQLMNNGRPGAGYGQ